MSGAGPSRPAPQLIPEELLQIDVAAELQTLSEAQLQGPWQAPAELVRLGIERGASSVAVTVHRHGFTVVAEGAAIPQHLLRQLASAVDGGQPLEERHKAIVSLEHAQAEPLLWACGLAGATARISSRDGEQVAHCQLRTGQRPRLSRVPVPPGAPRLEVEISGITLETRRTTDWTHTACRFAAIPVQLNGQRLEGSFPDGLYRMRLQEPLPGILGITSSGDAPKLWLLRDGVLVTRATVPGYPAFHAAVEMAGICTPGVSAAATREAVTPYLPGLIDQAVVMLLRLTAQLPEMPECSRRRITCLLLRAAKLGLRRREIAAAALIEVLGGGRGWMSLDELAALASDGRGRTLRAIDPAQLSRRISSAAGPLVMASLEERGLLAELLSLHFQTPPMRRRLSPLAAVRGALTLIGRVLARGWGRLIDIGRGRVLHNDELSDEERSLLSALELRLAESDEQLHVAFCMGSGAPRQRSHRLLLPRRNRTVRRCVQAAADDPAWLYPVLLVLRNDGPAPPQELRTRWVRSCFVGTQES